MFRFAALAALLVASALSITACIDYSDDPDDTDDITLLANTEFGLYGAGAVHISSFAALQDFVPFEIALPEAPPDGTYLRGVTVHLGGMGDEERQRRSTKAILSFSTLDDRGLFHVEQVLARAEPQGVLVLVDISGIEGKLIDYRADENRLYWRACGRSFVMGYPLDYLEDAAVTDFAASLSATCE
ncbi:MAG: hypothetical protein HOH95_06500 [Dehalococcoidia bacterium]|jgi:hypothetical protein|nr:hypothetical protein [Dehalococcoidia bacterium]